ncbi:MAG: phosphonate dehydrogenase [Pseudomonadota bacterium]
MTQKIVVPNWIEGQTLDLLRAVGAVVSNTSRDPMSPEDLRSECRDATALMAFMTEAIDASFLDACPRLRIVAGALKGFDNIDVEACSARGVVVSIVPDLLTEPTAELALGLMIALARNLRDGDAHVRSGAYAGWRSRFYGGSLQGATVGVIGAGAVGREILRLLSGFRGTRLYYDTRPLDPTTEKALVTQFAPMDAIVAQSDFVVLALPLTSATLGLVDAAFLSRMKPGARLINPARGSLVDEAAVVAALESEHLSGYATDVYEMEDWARAGRPREVHSGLLTSDRTVLTPHIGSAVVEVRREIAASAAQSIITMLKGDIPATAINTAQLNEAASC